MQQISDPPFTRPTTGALAGGCDTHPIHPQPRFTDRLCLSSTQPILTRWQLRSRTEAPKDRASALNCKYKRHQLTKALCSAWRRSRLCALRSSMCAMRSCGVESHSWCHTATCRFSTRRSAPADAADIGGVHPAMPAMTEPIRPVAARRSPLSAFLPDFRLAQNQPVIAQPSKFSKTLSLYKSTSNLTVHQ